MQHSPAHCTAPLWSKVGIAVVHEVGFCSCKFLNLPGVCPAYRPESWRSPASRTARTDCRLRHWVDSSKSIRHAKNCQHMSRFQDARIPSRPAPQEAKHERERWRMVTNGDEQDERWRTVTKLSKNSLLEVIAVEYRNHVMSRPMGNTPWAHTSGCPWFKIGAASGKRISDNRTNPVHPLSLVLALPSTNFWVWFHDLSKAPCLHACLSSAHGPLPASAMVGGTPQSKPVALNGTAIPFPWQREGPPSVEINFQILGSTNSNRQAPQPRQPGSTPNSLQCEHWLCTVHSLPPPWCRYWNCCHFIWYLCPQKKEPTNSNAVTRNTFVKQVISTLLYILPLLPYQYRLWSLEWGGVQSVECKDSAVLSGECSM